MVDICEMTTHEIGEYHRQRRSDEHYQEVLDAIRDGRVRRVRRHASIGHYEEFVVTIQPKVDL